MITAARLPLRKDPAKSQFLRPGAQSRVWFSAQLLSMGTAPWRAKWNRIGSAWQVSRKRRAGSSTFGWPVHVDGTA